MMMMMMMYMSRVFKIKIHNVRCTTSCRRRRRRRRQFILYYYFTLRNVWFISAPTVSPHGSSIINTMLEVCFNYLSDIEIIKRANKYYTDREVGVL